MNRNRQKFSLYDLTPPELKSFFLSIGGKEYRARQVMDFLYRHPSKDFDDYTTLSKVERENLKKSVWLAPLRLKFSLESEDGAIKLAYIPTGDEKSSYAIESVWMPSESTDTGPLGENRGEDKLSRPERHTLCISSQIGCAAGCSFCATGRLGLKRQLSAGEIVYQVINCQVLYDKLPDTVLFMGMGEPMHNFESVAAAIEILTHPDTLAFSQRRIVVSTVGELGKLGELHRRFPSVRLAISLAAATDSLRSNIVPVNDRFNLRSIQEFVKSIDLPKGGRITFEYVLLKGVNDTSDQIKALSGYLKPISRNIKVNLIPYNQVDGLGYETTPRQRVLEIQRLLRDKGIMTFVRRNRGRKTSVACGQLAGRF